MDVTMSGHHLELTQPIKTFTHEKFSKLERHAEDISSAHVILSVDKNIQKAEAKLHYKGTDIFADATASDLYVAIDSMTDKLDRQILKHKAKSTKKRA